jgi:hypothetical protein
MDNSGALFKNNGHTNRVNETGFQSLAQGLPFMRTWNWHAEGKRNTGKLDFEISISHIILHRNSQICFHKLMPTKTVEKTTMHVYVHALRPNIC